MKKTLKIAAFLLALALIAGLGWFANAFLGNPLSEWLAQRSVEQYMQQHYSNRDYAVEDMIYSFKDGNYHASIRSESSQDTHFQVSVDLLGRVLYDSYESVVLSGENTMQRLNESYRVLTDTVFDSPAFPYSGDIAFGTLNYSYPGEAASWENFPFSIPVDSLELDGQYDIRQLGAQAGVLVVYVQDPEVSVSRAAGILLEIRNQFDRMGVPFRGIDFTLRYPKPQDDSPRPQGEVFARLTYDQLQEATIAEAVEQSNQAISQYYAQQDAMKP